MISTGESAGSIVFKGDSIKQSEVSIDPKLVEKFFLLFTEKVV